VHNNNKEETKMEMEPSVIAIIVGVVIALFIIIVIAYKSMYKKIPPDAALVVSGGKVTKAYFGGKFVSPITSQAQEISLNTMNLKVERKGDEALITKDSLRVDIVAYFFVRIEKNGEDVLAAAASLGEKSATPESVSELLEGKLVHALRAVAATMELQELHDNRQEFQDAVQEACLEDLKQNGLTLETVSITSLDQTPLEELDPDNIFDAVAIQTICAMLPVDGERRQMEEEMKRDKQTYRRLLQEKRSILDEEIRRIDEELGDTDEGGQK